MELFCKGRGQQEKGNCQFDVIFLQETYSFKNTEETWKAEWGREKFIIAMELIIQKA